MARAHMACWDEQEQVYQHVCQDGPVNRECVEDGCKAVAGTWWTPLWCPDHDLIRLNRISAQFEKLAQGYREMSERKEAS